MLKTQDDAAYLEWVEEERDVKAEYESYAHLAIHAEPGDDHSIARESLAKMVGEDVLLTLELEDEEKRVAWMIAWAVAWPRSEKDSLRFGELRTMRRAAKAALAELNS
jgi:hypothetical protein